MICNYSNISKNRLVYYWKNKNYNKYIGVSSQAVVYAFYRGSFQY